MAKRVILVTGTPCIGKTTTAKQLASKLDAHYENLTELAIKDELTLGRDEERDSAIVDEAKMKKRIRKIIKRSDNENIVIDGHYAPSVVPQRLVSHVFVLRRNPMELEKMMKHSGFPGRKISENLASEILDVCLVDALNVHERKKVCEIDVTGKPAKEILKEILEVLDGSRKCRVGIVDWLGMLEKEGVLDDYLET